MEVQFDISALAETLAEGGSYTFTLTPKETLSGAVGIRWVIVPKGKVPITANDFIENDLPAFTGAVTVASGATTSDVQTITITPTDDSVAEASGTFEIQVYQVVTGGDDLLIDSQDVILTDDEAFAGLFTSDLRGSSTSNNFFFGGSGPLDAEGFNGNDAYVISRYQSGNVDLTDADGSNIIKFDYGAEISSARGTGRGSTGGELLLVTDSSSTATVTWASPLNWQYQIADGDVLTWAEFLTFLGLTGTGGALTETYTVDALASDTVVDGNDEASELLGSPASEVLSFGNDGRLDAEGFAGDDVYVISRYQSANVDLTDGDGLNIIKFDFEADISSARGTGSW